jgi:hypothetical protein
MRSPRRRCPVCDRRRVLYAAELVDEHVCQACAMELGLAAATIRLGVIIRVCRDPDFIARIEAISASAASIVRLLADT